MLPDISIIFPNLNPASNTLTKFLKSALNQQGVTAEIILVDNGSPPDTLMRVKKEFPGVVILPLGENLGFAAAVNQGTKIAQGKYFFFTNNDCVLSPLCLQELLTYTKKHPRTGIAGPLTFADQREKYVDSGVHTYSLTTGLFSNTFCHAPTPTAWVSGSALFISKKLFGDLEGFDEIFFFYFEDLDICLRAKVLGFAIVCIPQARVYHKRGTTANLNTHRPRSLFLLHRGRQVLLIKHGNILQILTGLTLQLFVYSVYHAIIKHDGSNVPLLKVTLNTFSPARFFSLIKARFLYQQWKRKVSHDNHKKTYTKKGTGVT